MNLKSDIHFSSPPTLLVGWPGVGNVGLLSIDYLRNQLDAIPFAELDMSTLVVPESMVVKEGLAKFPDLPNSIFHYTRAPDLIFFETTAQVTGKESISVIHSILEVAERFRAQRILTAEAFVKPISHNTPSRVLCASNSNRLLKRLESFGLNRMHTGKINGLSGLLLGISSFHDIDAGCLLAGIPSYAGALSYPKASVEVLRTIGEMIHTPVDLSEMEHMADEMDETLESIEERIREFFPSAVQQEDQDLEPSTDTETPEERAAKVESEISDIEEGKDVPAEAMWNIEQLFKEVELDHARAPELKAELDKWGVYDQYEKRFLDLFRNG